MTNEEFEQWKRTQYDWQTEQFDYVCEQRLKQIHKCLSNEAPPYPPAHAVTLARAVHVLAMRTLADEHPSKHPHSKSYVSNGRRGLHQYWVTVFKLNDEINREAQTGALRLRDRLTGLPIQEWRTPSKVECSEWERNAIFPGDDKKAAERRAVEIMDTFKWGLLAPHFDASIVVSLQEFDAWATSLGIVDTGGVIELLRTLEAEAAERARITAAAIEAEKRGDVFDYTQWQAGTQKLSTDTQATLAAPLQRAAAQDAAILNAIRQAGYDPMALPKNEKGKPGVRAEVRNTLARNPLFAGTTVFNKAWERLQANKDIQSQG